MNSWLFWYSTLVNILRQNANGLPTDTEQFYYLDIFAINQHDVTKEGELDKLGETIVECGTLLLASSPWSAPLPLTRAWCLYELHIAATSKIPIEICLSSGDRHAFYEAAPSHFQFYI